MNTEQLLELLRNPKLLNAETAMEIRVITEEFPWFQFGWMLFAKNLKQIESPAFESILKKTAVLVPNRKLLFDFLNEQTNFTSTILGSENTFSLTDNEQPGEKSGESGSLIDKFLMAETSTLARKPLMDTQTMSETTRDVEEKSTSESDEMITETLANIYFQQKKYEKALHAYQKLSLKYPEKSIYFASRIKEIENLTHNN